MAVDAQRPFLSLDAAQTVLEPEGSAEEERGQRL